MVVKLIDKNYIDENVMKDDVAIRSANEDMRARATFDRFLRLVGISPEKQRYFKVINSDTMYVAPNNQYVMALRYSKNYDRMFSEDPRRAHFWWTLKDLKDSIRKNDSCMNIYLVFCCHTHCSDNVDMSLWQCCDEFLSIPIIVFKRNNIDLMNIRPHFYKNENNCFEWRDKKRGIQENLNRYLNTHLQLFRDYK